MPETTAAQQPEIDDAPTDAPDHFITRGGARYAGAHIIVDLYDAQNLNEIGYIEDTLRRCVEAAGATLLHILLHRFEPNGVTGVAILAESHISVHTWPDQDFAAFDVFMCGSTRPEVCVEILRAAFQPDRVVVSEHLRGQGLVTGGGLATGERLVAGGDLAAGG